MAEAPRNRLPSGHDEEFVSEVDDDFHCLICQLPLRQPVLTRCGHRYCKECLEEHLRRQEAQAQSYSCPADREALDRDRGVFPDKATERTILSLAIKCPSDGCEWTGELRNKEAHLATCPFEEVPCTNENCHVSLKRTDLEQHVTIMCKWRIIECKYCKERHPECHMKSHLERCCKYPLSCPNNCGARISREEATMHIKNDCPQTLVRCSLDWIGCNSEIRRGELESHLSCETRHHLDLACSKLNATRKQAEINTRELDRLDKCQKENKEEILNLQNQRNQLQESVNTLERQLEERVNNLHALINKNEIKIGRKVFWITSVFFVAVVGMLFKIHTDQERMSVLQSQLVKRVDGFHSHLEKRVGYVQKTLNTFTCKITDFESVLERAKIGHQNILERGPFYLHGYKLRLSIYPNGIGRGEGTHLSLFVVIMKGENDAVLPWPFLKKVDVKLVDQQDDPEERWNAVFTCIGSKGLHVKEFFGRPVNDSNTRYGFSTSISHKRLKTRRYIVDDTLFIQTLVS